MPYILSLTVLSACFALAFFAGCSGAPAPTPSGSAAEPKDWRAFANERIEQIRKGDFTVTLVDADGRPLPERTPVTFRQTRSHFIFGTAINSDFRNDNELERNYRNFITRHFNTLVDENHMKWYSIEPERGQRTFRRADDYIRFAREHGMHVRGHTLFWAKEKFVARQPWLLELEGDELKQAMEDHIRITMNHFKGKVIAWDVNNEMLTGHWFRDRLGDAIRVWMFKRAHELDPDVPLYVNEYAILGAPGKTGEYIQLIQNLKDSGAPIHGIGIQEHACERIVTDMDPDEDHEERLAAHYRITPMQLWESLEELSKFGLPIHMTEISARHPDVEVRADGLEALFRMSFAHPKVEAILLWGFWGGRHWLGSNASLVDDQMQYNAAGERIFNMLLNEWRTNASVELGPGGNATFRGFYGTYEVFVGDGQEPFGVVQFTVEFTPDRKTESVWVPASP